MTKYAEGTEVPAERSRMEIERTLSRYGASNFFYGTDALKAAIGFRAHDRYVKFVVSMPTDDDVATVKTKMSTTGSRTRTAEQARAAKERLVRQRWRCLALVVKAKLEAVDSGIATFEEEFLANIVMPDGSCVADHALPAVAKAYKTGKAVPLLPAGVV